MTYQPFQPSLVYLHSASISLRSPFRTMDIQGRSDDDHGNCLPSCQYCAQSRLPRPLHASTDRFATAALTMPLMLTSAMHSRLPTLSRTHTPQAIPAPLYPLAPGPSQTSPIPPSSPTLSAPSCNSKLAQPLDKKSSSTRRLHAFARLHDAEATQILYAIRTLWYNDPVAVRRQCAGGKN
jgi:hypothetical protein